jgi:hypothetical protein
MPVLLAALIGFVVVYCLARAAAPTRWARADQHRRDIDAWHVVMGAAMILMLLGHLSRPFATVALVLSGVAVCWGALSTDRRSGSSARVRLLVGATAMAVMTLPLAAPAEAAGAGAASSGMSGMSMGGTPSTPLVVLLVAALGLVTAARLPTVVRSSAGAVNRLDACCDVVMAGAMAVMLAALL